MKLYFMNLSMQLLKAKNISFPASNLDIISYLLTGNSHKKGDKSQNLH